jgi:hypothetical protein
MTLFLPAVKAGLLAYQSRHVHLKEIDTLFKEVREAVHQATQNRVTLDLFLTSTGYMLGVRKEDPKLPVIQRRVVYLAGVEKSEVGGYPVFIKARFDRDEWQCRTLEELEAALQEFLTRAYVGKHLQDFMMDGPTIHL